MTSPVPVKRAKRSRTLASATPVSSAISESSRWPYFCRHCRMSIKVSLPLLDAIVAMNPGDENLHLASARFGGLGLRALDVEQRGEADPLAGGHQAQRLVLRGRNRAHRVELAQCSHEGEIVRRHIRYDQKTNAARDVLRRARVGGGRSGPSTQAPGDVDFPGDVDAALPTLRVGRLRHELLGGRVVTGPVIEARALDPNARIQP